MYASQSKGSPTTVVAEFSLKGPVGERILPQPVRERGTDSEGRTRTPSTSPVSRGKGQTARISVTNPGCAVTFEPQRGDSQPQVLGHGWTDECVRGLHRGADRTFPKLRFRRNVSIGFGRSLPMTFCRKPSIWSGFGGSLPMTFCRKPSILSGFGGSLPMTFG